MSKITLEMKSDRINAIISDYCTQDDLKDIEKDSQEEMVDIRVFNLMETMYPDNTIVAQNKKNEPVYMLLKSKQHDGKRGRSDITLFNYFENNSIDIMIENKFDKTKGNPINEAIEYCNNINDSGIYTCRVAIGFNLYDNSQLITKVLDENGTWSDLKINGKVINGFIGQEILQLIYSHAGVSEFNFKVKTEEKYSRGEFKKILDSDLPIIFRKMSDIANDDGLKISFTVAFISLKVILEKQEDLKNKKVLSNEEVLNLANTDFSNLATEFFNKEITDNKSEYIFRKSASKECNTNDVVTKKELTEQKDTYIKLIKDNLDSVIYSYIKDGKVHYKYAEVSVKLLYQNLCIGGGFTYTDIELT